MNTQPQWLWRAVLTAFAVWSGGALLVVETGLGARYSLHPDAARDESAVPTVNLIRGEQALGPFESYAVIAQRPLFNFDRLPLPSPDAPAEAPASVAPLNVVLTSVVLMGDAKIAIVNDPAANKSQSVRLGSSLQGDQAGWKLVELEPRRAVFEGPGGRTAADIRVFDGQGGEPPTPLAAAPIQESPPDGSNPAAGGGMQGGQASVTDPGAGVVNESPESRAEQIRRRIEERRRQMREEAERANAERGK